MQQVSESVRTVDCTFAVFRPAALAPHLPTSTGYAMSCRHSYVIML